MFQFDRGEPLLSEVLGQPGVKEALEDIANDLAASAKRIAVCDAIALALRKLGEPLWVSGSLIGSDRKEGISPWGFGDDRVVGIAVVAQAGGELASGSIALLKDGNRYASAALTRQVLEIEYLAHAFAEDDETARDWLRADRNKRRKFWSPARLRDRAAGAFLLTDYWDHCDMGGHPSEKSMLLLPGHQGLSLEVLWTDLAMHLVSTWRLVLSAAERALGKPAPSDWDVVSDVEAAITDWYEADGFAAAMRNLGRLQREEDA